jgi:hypothetical protein
MTFKWYTPENVRNALIGPEGSAEVEREADAMAEMLGERADDLFVIRLRGIRTTPPPGRPVFEGNAQALVRRTKKAGLWTVLARMPAGYCDGCVIPYRRAFGLGPWPREFVTAYDLGLRPNTGDPLNTLSESEKATRDIYWPKALEELVLLRLDTPPYRANEVPAEGKWTLAMVSELGNAQTGVGLAWGAGEGQSGWVKPGPTRMVRAINHSKFDSAIYMKGAVELIKTGRATGNIREILSRVGMLAYLDGQQDPAARKLTRRRTGALASRYQPVRTGEFVLVQRLDAEAGKECWAIGMAVDRGGKIVVSDRLPEGFDIDACGIEQIPTRRQKSAETQFNRHDRKAWQKRAVQQGITSVVWLADKQARELH